MIKVEELRIGNWVLEDGEYILVEKLEYDGQINNNYHFDPIPLTEEILLKCGFEYEGDLLLINIQGGEISYEYGCIYLGMGHYYQESNQLEIKHLHQLQNLYFALTVEELNIEL